MVLKDDIREEAILPNSRAQFANNHAAHFILA